MMQLAENRGVVRVTESRRHDRMVSVSLCVTVWAAMTTATSAISDLIFICEAMKVILAKLRDAASKTSVAAPHAVYS